MCRLLRHRVEAVNRAFQSAISEFGYRSHYRGVFPIKVNQLREVIEEIVDAGQEWHFGLEAGSKPELIAALAMHKDLESLIVCNGYKDRAYIRSAMLGRRLGKSVIIVGPDKHLGGLSSGGLGMTDTGNKAVIGGLARDFYHRIWKEYQKPG